MHNKHGRSDDEITLRQINLSNGFRRHGDRSLIFEWVGLYTQLGSKLGDCDININDIIAIQYNLRPHQGIIFVPSGSTYLLKGTARPTIKNLLLAASHIALHHKAYRIVKPAKAFAAGTSSSVMRPQDHELSEYPFRTLSMQDAIKRLDRLAEPKS